MRKYKTPNTVNKLAMQLFYEGDFEAATLNGNEILQLRQLTQLRDGRFFSIQLPGGSQVMPSDDIPPSRVSQEDQFLPHLDFSMQSKGNKDNRGDILVFRAFLFPLCSNSCCWITSFARLVPSHNGESLTMVGANSWLCSTYTFWFSGCCLHRRQCQHFLSNSKLPFFWSSFSECTYYILHIRGVGWHY